MMSYLRVDVDKKKWVLKNISLSIFRASEEDSTGST